MAQDFTLLGHFTFISYLLSFLVILFISHGYPNLEPDVFTIRSFKVMAHAMDDSYVASTTTFASWDDVVPTKLKIPFSIGIYLISTNVAYLHVFLH